MDINYKAIGQRIRYYRTQKGLSQEDMAELADVSFVYISQVERAQKSASLKTIISIANALSISVDSLLVDNLKRPNRNDNDELFGILYDCTKEEHDILINSLVSLKDILRQYNIK